MLSLKDGWSRDLKYLKESSKEREEKQVCLFHILECAVCPSLLSPEVTSPPTTQLPHTSLPHSTTPMVCAPFTIHMCASGMLMCSWVNGDFVTHVEVKQWWSGFGQAIWSEAGGSGNLFKQWAFTNVSHTHRLRTLGGVNEEGEKTTEQGSWSMCIWCPFTVKTNAIFNVILGISHVWSSQCVCMHNKEKRLLKLCTVCVCHICWTPVEVHSEKKSVKAAVPQGITAHTHADTNTLLFSLKHLGILCCCAGKSRFPSTKTIFHLIDGTQLFVYSLLHSITSSLVCLTFHTHDLIFCLVALQICKLMPQLSAEAACGVEFIKPPCPLRVCVCTSQNIGIPGK